MQAEPLGDRVLIRPAKPDEFTKGGILLPDTAKEKRCEGIVLEVGPGRVAPDTGRRIDPQVKPGDYVIYEKYAGTEIKVQGEDCIVLKESGLLLRMKDSSTS